MTLSAVGTALLMAAGLAGASPSSIGTFTLSGQAKGTLIIAKGATCKPDNISISRGVATVRLYFTDTKINPTNDQWYVLISSKGIEARFPSTTSAFTLGVKAGATIDEEWNAGAKLGSGSVTFTDHYKSGTLNVSLAPVAGQKGRGEKIAGTWVCTK
ncbi:MAG: hypothetical protein JWM55_80 [Acidimicrobiaceae bacterium]|nr:hypothetical protein [Acidimicrobiaceae bacterium]